MFNDMPSFIVFIKSTVDNRLRIIKLGVSREIFHVGTWFAQKESQNIWNSPNGAIFNQVSYLLIERCHLSVLMNIRTYKEANMN